MWFFGYIVGTLAAIVDLILVIISVTVPDDSMWGAVVVLTLVVVGLFVSSTKAPEGEEGPEGTRGRAKQAFYGR